MRRAFAFAVVALLAGCSGQASREEPRLVPLHSKLKFAEIEVDEAQDGVADLADQSRRRALAELDGLARDQNWVFSPWALVREERLIADANGSDDDPAVAAMIGQLEKWRGDPTKAPSGGGEIPILLSQTALIADRSLDIAPGFLDLLAKDYDIGVYLARPGDPKLADAVNAWAMGTANTRIDRPMAGLGSARGVYVADVTALLAGWQLPFLPEFTADAPFTASTGDVVEAPTMRGVAIARTAVGVGWRAAEIALADGLELRLVVPADPSGSLAGELVPARDALAAARPGPVGVALPRWSARSDLTGAPAPVGARTLTGLAPEARINGWASQAAASFGERGVSAAPAAPGRAQDAPPGPPPEVSFAVDRTFCFEIFDPGTGLVLLAGRVANPGR